jgi:hypothetical protein
MANRLFPNDFPDFVTEAEVPGGDGDRRTAGVRGLLSGWGSGDDAIPKLGLQDYKVPAESQIASRTDKDSSHGL